MSHLQEGKLAVAAAVEAVTDEVMAPQVAVLSSGLRVLAWEGLRRAGLPLLILLMEQLLARALSRDLLLEEEGWVCWLSLLSDWAGLGWMAVRP